MRLRLLTLLFVFIFCGMNTFVPAQRVKKNRKVLTDNSDKTPMNVKDAGSKCALALEQAPEMRGLRLGLSKDQVIALFLGLKVPPPDELGVSQVLMRQGDKFLYKKPLFTDVKKVVLEFMEEKLTSMQIDYDTSIQWEGEEEFQSHISKKLNLTGKWMISDEKGPIIECQGFIVSAGIEGNPYIRVEDKQAAHTLATRKKLVAQRVAEEEKRRQREAEEQKRAFKP